MKFMEKRPLIPEESLQGDELDKEWAVWDLLDEVMDAFEKEKQARKKQGGSSSKGKK